MDLVDVLASIYESPQDAKRLADGVRINTRFVATSGLSPVEFWHATIEEAKRSGKLGSLLMAAIREYPENSDLNNFLIELLADSFDDKTSAEVARLEARIRRIETTLEQQQPPPAPSLTPRTMTEAIIFALIVIVLVFALRG